MFVAFAGIKPLTWCCLPKVSMTGGHHKGSDMPRLGRQHHASKS
jgi:uncharacterized protein YcbX